MSLKIWTIQVLEHAVARGSFLHEIKHTIINQNPQEKKESASHLSLPHWKGAPSGAKDSPPSSPQGALRAILGGPPAVGFFPLWTDVCGIKSSSRNKSRIFPKVLIYEEFDSFNDFLLGPRDLLSWDRFWTDFGVILKRILEISFRIDRDRSEISFHIYLRS